MITIKTPNKYINEPDILDLDEIKARINQNTRVIWICNPNNPIGAFIK